MHEGHSKPHYQEDAYRQSCVAQIVAVTATGVVLDQTVFYPLGGGQPGDTGTLTNNHGEIFQVIDTRKGERGEIVHVLADASATPAIGSMVEAVIDWPRRHRHMRMHTCMHLLGALIPEPVTGGSVGADKSRLDFNLPESPDKEALTAKLNDLIDGDHPVSTRWISDAELDANPELVRTMSVSPPRGAGRIRLLQIGEVDLQPCGGTHVRSTAEIGVAVVSKIENKGKQNRRFHLQLLD
jgi:misacylated tRNA(Ala) deacylase